MTSVEILLLFIVIIIILISLHSDEYDPDNVDYMRSVIDEKESKGRFEEEKKDYLHCPLCGYSGDWNHMQTHISNHHKCNN